MVAIIGSAQAGELVGISEPVEVAAVHNASTYLACCTVHVFCGAVSHDVSSPFKRTTVDGSGKSIVNDEWHAILMGNACKLLNVEHSASRIANCLAENNLCIWTESLLDFLFRVIRIDKSTFDTQFLECYTEQVECSSINLVACHDMVASLADVEYCVEVGCLSTACKHGSNTTLKLCNLLSYNVVGRVLQTCVEVSFLL